MTRRDGNRPSARALRVALLTPSIDSETPGAGAVVGGLAYGLLAGGHHPRVITSHVGRPVATVEHGLPIVRHWRPPEGRLRRRDYDARLTHVPLSYLSLRRGEDDLAHAFHHADAAAALRWSRRSGRPVAYTCTIVPDHAGLTSRRGRLELTVRAVKDSAAVFAPSRWAADCLRRWLGVEAQVVHPSVDLRSFKPVSGRAEEPTIFCPVQPELERNRIPLLLAAFDRLRRSSPKAQLRLPRPRNPALARALEESGPGISLVEPARSAARAREYGRAWVSVLPSYRDPLGVALVESLACGTPVVAADRDSFPELVDREAVGLLFDDSDAERLLTTALLETLELTNDRTVAASCRARAEELSRSATTEHLRVYAELLTGEPPLRGRAPTSARGATAE